VRVRATASWRSRRRSSQPSRLGESNLLVDMPFVMDRSDAGKLGYQKSIAHIQAFVVRQKTEARERHSGKTCLCCGVPIPYERRRNKFCSRSCSAAHSNRGCSRHPPRPTPLCLCAKPAKPGDTYCSVACAARGRSNRLQKTWLEGLHPGGSWRGVSDFVRRWLIESFGERCSLCGWAEVHPATGRVPLQVDHIDGNPMNHQPRNLRLICPNCHALTPTFGGLNRGKGRTARYKKLPS